MVKEMETLYDVRERKENVEAGEVPEYTVSAWMENLLEVIRDYEVADIWNIYETGCFFKAPPEKGLAEKRSQASVGRKSKSRLTIPFFVIAAREKVIERLVIWRSATPRYFKNVQNRESALGTYYYFNQKSWMMTEIMTSVLSKINRKIEATNRKITLHR